MAGMIANPFPDNELEETCRRGNRGPLQQDIEAKRVAPDASEKNAEENGALPDSNSANFLAGSEIRTAAALLHRSVGGNLLAMSDLRRWGGQGSAQNYEAERGRQKNRKKLISAQRFVRWWKFNFVGAIGIGVQFVALLVSKSVFHLNYLAATALAVEIAVLHNFIWHERFTWADRNPRSSVFTRLVRFHLGNGAVSILGNLALMKVLVGYGHIHYLVANAIAIALCSLANFLLSDEWVFGN